MSEILLSIIIPCFNVERFIKETLESILTQEALEKIEVLIINDGSTDNTLNVIKDLCRSYPNCKIFDVKNSGVSASRNLGLQHANGEYITFLDGDDRWAERYWSVVKPILENEEPDIVEFNARQFDAKNNTVREIKITDKTGMTLISNSKKELSAFFVQNQWYAWARIYKREILKKHSFDIGRRYEEVLLVPYIYYDSSTVYSINEMLIEYRINADGITQNIKLKDVDDIRYALDRMLLFVKANPAARTIFYHSVIKVYSFQSYLIRQLKKSEVEISPFYKQAERIKEIYKFKIMPWNKKVIWIKFPKVMMFISLLRK